MGQRINSASRKWLHFLAGAENLRLELGDESFAGLHQKAPAKAGATAGLHSETPGRLSRLRQPALVKRLFWRFELPGCFVCLSRRWSDDG